MIMFLFYFITLESYTCNTENDCCGEETAEDCCDSGTLCSVGEGGCTSDSHCKGDLICGTGNCDASLGFPTGNKMKLNIYIPKLYDVVLDVELIKIHKNV